MLQYPKRELSIIAECNDEITGEPACWSMESQYDPGTERKHFIWITKYSDKEYIVEDSAGNNLTNKVFKSLSGAKRAAEGIIWRQEESGYFTD